MLTLTHHTTRSRACSRWSAAASRAGAIVAALGLSLIATPTSPALAQSLPPAMVHSIKPLSAEDIAGLKKFVDDRAADLSGPSTPDIGGPEAARIKRARQELLEPLVDPQVAAPFRLEYSRQLEPLLTRLSGDPREIVAINALVIAGELATDQGVGILDKQAAAKSPVVRYAAARGFGQTFEALDRTAPALSLETVERMVRDTARRLTDDKDPHVTDALAHSLVAACRITAQGFQTVPSLALTELAQRLGARLRTASDKGAAELVVDTAINAGVAMREAIANPALRLGPAARVDVAGYAGDVLWMVSRAVKTLPTVDRDDTDETKAAKLQARALPAEAAALAETLIAVVSNDTYRSQKLGDLLKSGTVNDDAKFLVGVGAIIGPGGVLGKPPFDIKLDRWPPPR